MTPQAPHLPPPLALTPEQLGLSPAQMTAVRVALHRAGALTGPEPGAIPVAPVAVSLGAVHSRTAVRVRGWGPDSGNRLLSVWGAAGVLAGGVELRQGPAADGATPVAGPVVLTLCAVEDLVDLVRQQLGEPVAGPAPRTGGLLLEPAAFVAAVQSWGHGRAGLATELAGGPGPAAAVGDLADGPTSGSGPAGMVLSGPAGMLLLVRGRRWWWSWRIRHDDDGLVLAASPVDDPSLRRLLVSQLAPMVAAGRL